MAGSRPLYENVTNLKSSCEFPVSGLGTGEKLTDNEIIQFRAPNFRTSLTYPAYVHFSVMLYQHFLPWLLQLIFEPNSSRGNFVSISGPPVDTF